MEPAFSSVGTCPSRQETSLNDSDPVATAMPVRTMSLSLVLYFLSDGKRHGRFMGKIMAFVERGELIERG